VSIHYGKSRARSQRGIGRSIYDRFESLGDDCELGNEQRHFGSNKLGLFRFAATDIDGLIAAFDHGLDRLISDDTIEIVREHGEYRTRVAPYGTNSIQASGSFGCCKSPAWRGNSKRRQRQPLPAARRPMPPPRRRSIRPASIGPRQGNAGKRRSAKGLELGL
jgi:hypothetical protein